MPQLDTLKPSKNACGPRRTPCARTPTTPAEYFLTQFADQKAHDGGEFFTPVSLVSLIAHVLEPGSGTVLDPACGSGGMFVQSARVVGRHHKNRPRSSPSTGWRRAPPPSAWPR